jgi:hypothetical protein
VIYIKSRAKIRAIRAGLPVCSTASLIESRLGLDIALGNAGKKC